MTDRIPLPVVVKSEPLIRAVSDAVNENHHEVDIRRKVTHDAIVNSRGGQTEVEALKKQVKQLENEKYQYQRKIAELEDEMTDLKMEVMENDAFQKKIDLLKNNLNQKRQELMDLQSNVARERAERANNDNNDGVHFQELQSNYKKLQNDCESLLTNIQSLQSDCRRITSERDSLLVDNEALKSNNKNLERDQEFLLTNNAILKSKLDELENQLQESQQREKELICASNPPTETSNNREVIDVTSSSVSKKEGIVDDLSTINSNMSIDSSVMHTKDENATLQGWVAIKNIELDTTPESSNTNSDACTNNFGKTTKDNTEVKTKVEVDEEESNTRIAARINLPVFTVHKESSKFFAEIYFPAMGPELEVLRARFVGRKFSRIAFLVPKLGCNIHVTPIKGRKVSLSTTMNDENFAFGSFCDKILIVCEIISHLQMNGHHSFSYQEFEGFVSKLLSATASNKTYPSLILGKLYSFTSIPQCVLGAGDQFERVKRCVSSFTKDALYSCGKLLGYTITMHNGSLLVTLEDRDFSKLEVAAKSLLQCIKVLSLRRNCASSGDVLSVIKAYTGGALGNVFLKDGDKIFRSQDEELKSDKIFIPASQVNENKFMNQMSNVDVPVVKFFAKESFYYADVFFPTKNAKLQETRRQFIGKAERRIDLLRGALNVDLECTSMTGKKVIVSARQGTIECNSFVSAFVSLSETISMLIHHGNSSVSDDEFRNFALGRFNYFKKNKIVFSLTPNENEAVAVISLFNFENAKDWFSDNLNIKHCRQHFPCNIDLHGECLLVSDHNLSVVIDVCNKLCLFMKKTCLENETKKCKQISNTIVGVKRRIKSKASNRKRSNGPTPVRDAPDRKGRCPNRRSDLRRRGFLRYNTSGLPQDLVTNRGFNVCLGYAIDGMICKLGDNCHREHFRNVEELCAFVDENNQPQGEEFHTILQDYISRNPRLMSVIARRD